MFKSLHLKHRIFFSILLIASFSLIVGGVSYFYLQKVVKNYDHVVSINMGNLDKMADMKDNVRMIRARMYFIMGFPKGHETDVLESITKMEGALSIYEKTDKEYNDIPFVPGEEDLYKPMNESWKMLKVKITMILDLYKKEGASEKGNELLFKEFIPLTNNYFKEMDKLMDFQNNEGAKWSKDSKESASFSTKVSIGMMAISFIISIIFGTVLTSTLTSQLTFVITELNTSTPQLTASSSSMSSLSTELSSCATEQAAAVQETASSLEEISAMIRRNSDNANNAKTSSSNSLTSVKNGQQAVSNMLVAMDEINENNDSFNAFMAKNGEELTEMVRVITNISDKTKVINDIVFQTKLLSFNASVEAARAGEQGKGFAVVAEEVGNLAQMSGNAANEIKGLLEASIVKVNQMVNATKTQVERLVIDGKEKINMGIERAKECNSALAEINTAVISVESLVAEVAHASGEQSQGIEEVNKAMGQIDEVTNQNSIASQSVATNAAQVMQLSSSIKDTSDKLTQLLTGGKELKLELKIEKKIEKKMEKMENVVSINKVDKKKVDIKKSVAKVKVEPMKMAVGAPMPSPIQANKKKGNELQLPSHDDSRFEDV